MKDLIKPPFANYDVVVYFGGGLFFIPFINRYLVEPTSLTWPRFRVDVGSSIGEQIVSGLTLLFIIYLLGHTVAYVGSQLIEKLMDRVLGKISTAILVSSWSSNNNRNEYVRALIYDRLSHVRRDRALFATLARGLFHLPVVPIYLIVYLLGIFGYYDTRVPYSIIRACRAKLKTIGVGNQSLTIRSKWYKLIEYYVANRNTVATARMYNYLVIGGLFRSLSLIFLISLWLQLYYVVHLWYDGDWLLRPFLGSTSWKGSVIEWTLVSTMYVFSLFSYLKFQRRYAEEAIFAFVLAPEVVTASVST